MSSVLYVLLTRFAAPCQPGAGGNFLGFPTWYKYLEGNTVGGKCTVVFSLDSAGDIGKVLLAVVEIMLRIAALIAVGFVIYGGFRFITSQGDPDSARNARGTVINALIGLVIAIFATAIVSLIGGSLIQ